MSPILWTIISLVLLIVGVGVVVYSVNTITVGNKNNEPYASKHWVYIIVGLLVIVIAFFVMYFAVIKNYKKRINELEVLYKTCGGAMPTSKSMNIFRRQEQAQQAQQYQ